MFEHGPSRSAARRGEGNNSVQFSVATGNLLEDHVARIEPASRALGASDAGTIRSQLRSGIT